MYVLIEHLGLVEQLGLANDHVKRCPQTPPIIRYQRPKDVVRLLKIWYAPECKTIF